MTLLRMIGRHVAGNVVAYLALFVAMSGTAYAVATVGSADVVDNSLQSRDLRDGAAVKGVDVAPNALTGADINELTLGKVPNADKLDGLDSSAFEPGGTVSTFGPTTVASGTQAVLTTAAPFQFLGTCPAFGSPEGPSLALTSSLGPWAYAAQSHSYVGSQGDVGDVGVPAGSQRLVIATGSSVVSVPAAGYAATYAGSQITYNVYMRVLNGSQGEPVCTYGGDVIAAP